MAIGTDTTKFTQIAEVQVWRDADGNLDLWYGNTLYHCQSLDELLQILRRRLSK